MQLDWDDSQLSSLKAYRIIDRPRTPRWHMREGDAAVWGGGGGLWWLLLNGMKVRPQPWDIELFTVLWGRWSSWGSPINKGPTRSVHPPQARHPGSSGHGSFVCLPGVRAVLSSHNHPIFCGCGFLPAAEVPCSQSLAGDVALCARHSSGLRCPPMTVTLAGTVSLGCVAPALHRLPSALNTSSASPSDLPDVKGSFVRPLRAPRRRCCSLLTPLGGSHALRPPTNTCTGGPDFQELCRNNAPSFRNYARTVQLCMRNYANKTYTYSPSVVSLWGPGQSPVYSSPHDAVSIFS